MGSGDRVTKSNTDLSETSGSNGRMWELQAEDFEDQGAIHHWTQRGQIALPGSSYYDANQAKLAECKDAKPIGVNYCVTSMFKKNMADESFTAVLNLNLRYKIEDDDLEIYEDLRRQGSIADIQELVSDASNLTSKPPVLEVMNSDSYDFRKWRVVFTQRCHDHSTGQWSCYVELSCQLMAQCEEALEVEKFPYCRQALQIHIQPKQDTGQLLLVPYEEPELQPKHCIDSKSGEVQETDLRMNGLTCQKHLGTYEVENHHAFFPPNNLLTPMPTGKLYSKCIITIQCTQKPAYVLWNTVPIVLFLPLFSSLALLEPITNVADRLGIVLGLLFTMAAYKTSTNSLMASKSYLTLLDKYILAGFSIILIVGVVVGFSGIVAAFSSEGAERRMSTPSGGRVPNTSEDEDANSATSPVEVVIVSILMGLWIAFHIAWFCLSQTRTGSKFFDFDPDWATVLKGENKSLRDRATLVRRLNDSQKKELTKLRKGLTMPKKPHDNDVNHALWQRLQSNHTKHFDKECDEEVISSLLTRLKDSEAAARHGALLGLRQVTKRGDKKVIEALVERFKDEEHKVQTAAAESLRQVVRPVDQHKVTMALHKAVRKEGAGGHETMGKRSPLGVQSVNFPQTSSAADLLPSLLMAMDTALASIPRPSAAQPRSSPGLSATSVRSDAAGGQYARSPPQAAPQAAPLAGPHVAEQALSADQQPNSDHHPRPNLMDRSPTSASASSAAVGRGDMTSSCIIESPSAAEVASSSSARSSSKKKKTTKSHSSRSSSSGGRSPGRSSGQ